MLTIFASIYAQHLKYMFFFIHSKNVLYLNCNKQNVYVIIEVIQ